jgi:hypothetical protein
MRALPQINLSQWLASHHCIFPPIGRQLTRQNIGINGQQLGRLLHLETVKFQT